MDDILKTAVGAAKEAGDFILNRFGKIKKIESKGDRNFATDVDKEAERLIIKKVKECFPDHGILAEESGKDNVDRDYLWIIDPLDGTHNFMRDINIFGVSIGVLHKGKFIAGVIYMPVDKEQYWAQTGRGAYKNGEKISVSRLGNLKECSISFDSSIRYSPEVMLAALGDLADSVFNIRMTGSSVRHLSWVAEDKLDAAVEFFDRPWDFAGGVCLIEEAGGKLSDLRGSPLTYKTNGYIAANGIVHDKIQKIVMSKLADK